MYHTRIETTFWRTTFLTKKRVKTQDVFISKKNWADPYNDGIVNKKPLFKPKWLGIESKKKKVWNFDNRYASSENKLWKIKILISTRKSLRSPCCYSTLLFVTIRVCIILYAYLCSVNTPVIKVITIFGGRPATETLHSFLFLVFYFVHASALCHDVNRICF